MQLSSYQGLQIKLGKTRWLLTFLDSPKDRVMANNEREEIHNHQSAISLF